MMSKPQHRYVCHTARSATSVTWPLSYLSQRVSRSVRRCACVRGHASGRSVGRRRGCGSPLVRLVRVSGDVRTDGEGRVLQEEEAVDVDAVGREECEVLGREADLCGRGHVWRGGVLRGCYGCGCGRRVGGVPVLEPAGRTQGEQVRDRKERDAPGGGG
jgi:hypothetical protein